MNLIIVAGIAIMTIILAFRAGWLLGGDSREDKIRRKGLEDINKHYEKMANKFKTVDQTIDHAKSLLTDSVRNTKNKSRNLKVLNPSGTSNRNQS